MNDQYGIELKLIMDKFKEKIQGIKNSFKSIENPTVNVKANTAQINYVKSQIEEIEYLLSRADKGFEVGDTLKLEAQLERLKNQYNQLIAKQNDLNVASNKANSNMEKGITKITNRIKRFGLSLFGIRSIFALVSRASSAYLSQDTALANKLQSVWAGLGAMLAPIIEGITNILAKAVKYINIFIKALTGVDLLARATSKSLGSMAKNAKAANKALAGFDELTNLDTDAGGGINTGGFEGLEDVKIDTTWADRIRQFGEWVKEHKNEIISFIAGLATTIELVKLGVKGIKALGIGVAISGVIYSIKSLIDYLKEPTWKNFGGIIEGIGTSILGLGISTKSGSLIIIGAAVLVYGAIIKYWDQIKEYLQRGIDWLTSKTDWVKEHFGNVGAFIYTNLVGILQDILHYFDIMFNAIKQNFNGWIQFIKGVFTGNWKQAWEGVKNIFGSILNELKATALFTLNSIIRGINTLIRGANRISFDVPNWVPGLGGKRWGFNIKEIPLLSVGTNYVPEDQLAYIHKGEAVVPKKFNSQEYFGNNEETNSLLREVINAVNNIEINPYTTVKDVGKASLQYINTRSRQLGESVVV